jgi:transposase-like protein
MKENILLTVDLKLLDHQFEENSYSIKSWRENWKEFTGFFNFPMEIRKII